MKTGQQTEYFGPCPKCGVLLGFGHLPETCSGDQLMCENCNDYPADRETADMVWLCEGCWESLFPKKISI